MGVISKIPGGNRVANDGVDINVQFWTTIDKTMLCVLASQNLRFIVFIEVNPYSLGLKIRVCPVLPLRRDGRRHSRKPQLMLGFIIYALLLIYLLSISYIPFYQIDFTRFFPKFQKYQT